MAIVRSDSKECPVCETPTLDYGGSTKSDTMVIVDCPQPTDFESGKILHGDGNKPLYYEFSKRGLDLYSMRLVSLYPHEKPSTRTKEGKQSWSRCCEYGLNKLLGEAKSKKYILCIGSEVTRFFLGSPDISCSGIPLKSRYLSANIVVGIQSLSYVSTNSCGEFCLALDNFVKEIKR